MIEIHNIHKTFNGVEVLKGISGVFQTGQTNLLLGASGTGKSVLLQCIVGLVKPDLGSITYDGKVFTNNRLDMKQEIRGDWRGEPAGAKIEVKLLPAARRTTAR